MLPRRGLSSALIKDKKYQAGGAIAGFIIIYGVLYASYDHMRGNSYEGLQQQYKSLERQYEALQRFSRSVRVKGKMDPYSGGNTRILITAREFNPDSDGKFSLEAPCIDIEDGAFLYVVREGKEMVSRIIFPEDDLKDLPIPIRDE